MVSFVRFRSTPEAPTPHEEISALPLSEGCATSVNYRLHCPLARWLMTSRAGRAWRAGPPPTPAEDRVVRKLGRQLVAARLLLLMVSTLCTDDVHEGDAHKAEATALQLPSVEEGGRSIPGHPEPHSLAGSHSTAKPADRGPHHTEADRPKRGSRLLDRLPPREMLLLSDPTGPACRVHGSPCVREAVTVLPRAHGRSARAARKEAGRAARSRRRKGGHRPPERRRSPSCIDATGETAPGAYSGCRPCRPPAT